MQSAVAIFAPITSSAGIQFFVFCFLLIERNLSCCFLALISALKSGAVSEVLMWAGDCD